jgi:hypothetical protein
MALFSFLKDLTTRLIIWILGTYRVVNGCPKSGNSGPTGISLFVFLLFYIGKITLTSPKVSLNDTDTPSNFKVDTNLP